MAETHKPDRWIVLRIKPEGEKPFLKVFATWAAGYLTGDSWRLNSGVKRVSEGDTHWTVETSSGSLYELNKGGYGIAGASNYNVLAHIEEKFGDQVKVLTETPKEWTGGKEYKL